MRQDTASCFCLLSLAFTVISFVTTSAVSQIVHDRPGFHSERYIWPVGYCSSRTYPSMRNPEMKCIYTCKILDGGFGPQVCRFIFHSLAVSKVIPIYLDFALLTFIFICLKISRHFLNHSEVKQNQS